MSGMTAISPLFCTWICNLKKCFTVMSLTQVPFLEVNTELSIALSNFHIVCRSIVCCLQR